MNNIDTSALKEALDSRYGDVQPTVPAVAQASSPRDLLPTGGANTPSVPPPQMPQVPQPNKAVGTKPGVPGGSMKDPKMEANKVIKSALNVLNDNYDPETQMQTKVLIAKLLQHA